MSRSTGLVLRSAGASLWFALMFFVMFPALILYVGGRSFRPPPGVPLWIGLALIVAAHGVVVRQVALFVREGRGTHAPFDPPRQLVETGLFGRVRNPMYLLYMIVILGEALAYRSVALLLYAGAFWLLAHAYVVGVEEKTLRRRFGSAYQDYCSRVPRWIPRAGAPAAPAR